MVKRAERFEKGPKRPPELLVTNVRLTGRLFESFKPAAAKHLSPKVATAISESAACS